MVSEGRVWACRIIRAYNAQSVITSDRLNSEVASIVYVQFLWTISTFSIDRFPGNILGVSFLGGKYGEGIVGIGVRGKVGGLGVHVGGAGGRGASRSSGGVGRGSGGVDISEGGANATIG